MKQASLNPPTDCDHAGVRHSNGTLECLWCGKLIVPLRLYRLYSGRGYEGKVVFVE